MSVLTTSARGASFLIAFQLVSRGFTFFVNQLLLRYLTPEVLGLSAQLDLYARTVISFARDSIEAVAQRQAGHSQPVVNIAYTSIVFGIPLAYVLAATYAKLEIANIASFSSALWIYAISCVIELLATPAYAVAQQRLMFKVRASAETTGTILRCVATAVAAIAASRIGIQASVLPFAAGQLAFALGFFAVYQVNIASTAQEQKFSMLPRKLAGRESYLGFIPRRSAQLGFSLFVQNAFKYVLTQGDGILIAALTSLADQGSYALASNYGGLIARMLFQPIEETTRTMFAQLCAKEEAEKDTHNNESDEQKQTSSVENARSLLENVLKFYSIIGLLACTIGPTIAPTLLSLVAGRRWANTQASSVLATYCYYIPLLAINGVTEGFVTAVATNKMLHLQSAMMILWFIAFGSAAWYFMRVLDMGARGLVLANCVNMSLRIIFNSWFIDEFFKSRRCRFQWSSISSNSFALAASIGTWSILHTDLAAIVVGKTILPRPLLEFGVAGVYGGIMLAIERKFLLQWVQPLIEKRFKRRAE